MSTKAAAVVLAGVVLSLSASCDDDGSDGADQPAPDSPSPSAVDGQQILDRLENVETVDDRPDVPGYDRDDFEWTDDHPGPGGNNGCDTRDDVLAAQLDDVQVADDGCTVLSGTLDDPYTGDTLAFDIERPEEVQTDHVVALAYAWDMGASEWTSAERLTFGNDQRSELLAVDGPTNQDKSDAGPAEWMPPNEGFHCEYALAFATVAAEYELAITDADAEALRGAASTCG